VITARSEDRNLHILRKTMMTKTSKNSGKPWSAVEVKSVGAVAKENTPTRVIGLKLGRSEGAVYNKASEHGISLKPTNQSPYERTK
jgi:pectin methylesterase-like acyl-CoA thioesterase